MLHFATCVSECSGFCRNRSIRFTAGCKELAAATTKWSVSGDVGRPRSFNQNPFNHSCIHTITIIQPCTCRRCRLAVCSKIRPPSSQAPAQELASLSPSLGAAGANVCVNFCYRPRESRGRCTRNREGRQSRFRAASGRFERGRSSSDVRSGPCNFGDRRH